MIIGERTWGKGSVQNVIELEDGRSALKLTTASYKRPSGKNIHRFPDAKETDEWGVMPDEGYELKIERRRNGRADPRIAIERDMLAVPHAKPPADGSRRRTERQAGRSQARRRSQTGRREAEPRKAEAGRANRPPAHAVVDRQLQKAVDYLTQQLARAQ